MLNPDQMEDCLLYLLNSFAGSVEAGPWALVRSAQYHMDDFGESIRMGDFYFARRNAGVELRRLSVYSAQRVWQLLIADNGREDEFRESMVEALRDLQRDASEAEAESREDLYDD